jgi:hypothetical protein
MTRMQERAIRITGREVGVGREAPAVTQVKEEHNARLDLELEVPDVRSKIARAAAEGVSTMRDTWTRDTWTRDTWTR